MRRNGIRTRAVRLAIEQTGRQARSVSEPNTSVSPGSYVTVVYSLRRRLRKEPGTEIGNPGRQHRPSDRPLPTGGASSSRARPAGPASRSVQTPAVSRATAWRRWRRTCVRYSPCSGESPAGATQCGAGACVSHDRDISAVDRSSSVAECRRSRPGACAILVPGTKSSSPQPTHRQSAGRGGGRSGTNVRDFLAALR